MKRPMIEGIFDECAGRGDDRSFNPQWFDERQGATVASAGRQHQPHAGDGRTPQRIANHGRQFIATVDERAVDVDR